MPQDTNAPTNLLPKAICEPCSGIQRNWRGAPGHAELLQGANRKESRDERTVTVIRFHCDRCGAAWDYENNKANQHSGWSLVCS